MTQAAAASGVAHRCRWPSASCDFEHSTPHEAGGRTCLCNGNPKCRFDHRLKQDPRWSAEQLESGEVRWYHPSARQYHDRADPKQPMWYEVVRLHDFEVPS